MILTRGWHLEEGSQSSLTSGQSEGQEPVSFPHTGCSHFKVEATPFVWGLPGRGWGHLVASLLGVSHPATPAGVHSPGQSLSWNPGWDCGHFHRRWWPFQACAPTGAGSSCFCFCPELPHRKSHTERESPWGHGKAPLSQRSSGAQPIQ